MAPRSKKQKRLDAIIISRVQKRRERKALEAEELMWKSVGSDSVPTFSTLDGESCSSGSDEEEYEEEILVESVPGSGSGTQHLPVRSQSPWSKFLSLFNTGIYNQLQGERKLKGMRGRAGFGESERSMQRKLKQEKDKQEQATGCIPLKRMFERGQEGENQLPLEEEVHAFLSPALKLKQDFTKARKDLEYRLKSAGVRKTEVLTGQWRTRHEIVLGYLSFRLRFPDMSATQAAEYTAAVNKRGGWVARRLREWSQSWIDNRLIPKGEQGNGRRMSLWYEDEKLELYIRSFMSEIGVAITARKLAAAVGTYLMSEEHESAVFKDLEKATIENGEEDGGRRVVYKRKTIRERVARRWLKRLGYRYRDLQKGIFIDGHEREDVVLYREEFINVLMGLWPLIVGYDKFGEMISKSPTPGNRLCIDGS